MNDTKDNTIEEEIEFTLEGLEIEGRPGQKTVELKVGPGQEKLIKLRATDGQWKIQTGISYGIY